MNAADRATLRYMCDPGVAHKQADTQEDVPLAKEDMEFYKERIVDMTEHMLGGGTTDDLMASQFHDYVKACVSYLRMEDVNDAYQEKYVNDASAEQVPESRVSTPPDGATAQADDLLVKKCAKPKSLRDFVVVANKPPPTPFPKEQRFDVHDSRHRGKRIHKKDNIDIVYGQKEGIRNTTDIKEDPQGHRERSKAKIKKAAKKTAGYKTKGTGAPVGEDSPIQKGKMQSKRGSEGL
jgi:hypothetical protein